MTRKHYIAVAKIVANIGIEAQRKLELAKQLADILGPLNKEFKRQRFIDACMGAN